MDLVPVFTDVCVCVCVCVCLCVCVLVFSGRQGFSASGVKVDI